LATLTTDRLFSHLWKAADILRGSIDSADYKNYILGLLFLKRLSDVFEEEAERIEAETGDHALAWDDPDEHVFFMPVEARWPELRKRTKQIGDALNKACAALEQANPRTLEGVLLGIDYNDPQKLGDTQQRDSLLSRLLNHFSDERLRNCDLAQPDVLGDAYLKLIEWFAEQAGKKGGEFYTPHSVVELLVRLLKPKAGMRICDPTVGSGGMLIECARHIGHHPGAPLNLTLAGQEKNLGTWAICKMNMVLHGIPDADIRKGDTIRAPQLTDGTGLMLFDRVIANPPFSLDEWGRADLDKDPDPYGRFRYGLPPKSRGDLAFLQHMVAVTKPDGMVGVVMPHGVLFRGASEGGIRKGLVEDDLFEAVIGLAPNLFVGTTIPAAILILNRCKPSKRRGKVFFVNAAECFEPGRNQNYLRAEHIARIARAFEAFGNEERFSRVVGLDEIRENDHNLNIGRYVDMAEPEEKIDVQAALKELYRLETERDAAAARMDALLQEFGYGTALPKQLAPTRSRSKGGSR